MCFAQLRVHSPFGVVLLAFDLMAFMLFYYLTGSSAAISGLGLAKKSRQGNGIHFVDCCKLL